MIVTADISNCSSSNRRLDRQKRCDTTARTLLYIHTPTYRVVNTNDAGIHIQLMYRFTSCLPSIISTPHGSTC